MNLDNVKHLPVTQLCDFCKAQGFLNQTIFNHEGWYYCQNCLVEIARMTKKSRQTLIQPSLF
jgi:hypothetical protein